MELIHRKFRYFALPSLRPGSPANRRQRQQARQEARALLDQAEQCLKAPKRWLPARFQQDAEATQQKWENALAAGEGRGGAAARAAAPKGECHALL